MHVRQGEGGWYGEGDKRELHQEERRQRKRLIRERGGEEKEDKERKAGGKGGRGVNGERREAEGGEA